MELVAHPDSCPNCKSNEIASHKKYQIKAGAERQIFYCFIGQSYFSETKNTFLFGLRTGVSRIILILNSLTEGQGINAITRTFNVGENTIYRWQERLSELKETPFKHCLPIKDL